MTFKLIPYLQRIAACRGEPLEFALYLDGVRVWCVDEAQAQLLLGLWQAWAPSAPSIGTAPTDPSA